MTPRRRSNTRVAPTVILVAAVGLGAGVATAFAQGWLPATTASLANSSAPWALVAFLLALLAHRPFVAAAFGALTLATLLAGYVIGAAARGDTSSSSLIVFWGLATVIVGPVLGAGAYWVRLGRTPWAAVGVGGMSGILVGEGVYGLTYIAETTWPPYWWAEIIVGIIGLVWLIAGRLRGVASATIAVAVTGAVATAFVLLYALDLITLLS